jgi:predicted ATPase
MTQEEILSSIKKTYEKVEFLYQQALQDSAWKSTMLVEGRRIVDLLFAYLLPFATPSENRWILLYKRIHGYDRDEKWDNFTDAIKDSMIWGNRAIHGDTDSDQMPNIEGGFLSIKKMYDNFFLYAKEESIDNPSSLSFLNSKNLILPFSITYCQIKNFYTIRRITISIPVDAQFVLFTGSNGEGKTSILQGIAIGLHTNFNSLQNIKKHTSIYANYKFNNNEGNRLVTKDKIHDNLGGDYLNHCIIGYGASRLQLQGAESQSDERNRQSPIHGLFRSNSILMNIGYWLQYQSEKIVAAVISIFEQILPSVKAKYNAEKRALEYWENNEILDSEQLSAGNKSILAMIGDMIIRLYQHQKDIEKISDLKGIVLIDELETHLHPKWQKEFPRLLAELFPNIQFIISTHSPIVFLGVPPDKTIVYNVTKNDKGETEVQKLNVDLANMLPDEILTSALFGMDNIRSAYNKGIEYLSVETTQERAKREDEEKKSAERSKNFKFNLPKIDDKDK